MLPQASESAGIYVNIFILANSDRLIFNDGSRWSEILTMAQKVAGPTTTTILLLSKISSILTISF
jgi:hypothetical protein